MFEHYIGRTIFTAVYHLGQGISTTAGSFKVYKNTITDIKEKTTKNGNTLIKVNLSGPVINGYNTVFGSNEAAEEEFKKWFTYNTECDKNYSNYKKDWKQSYTIPYFPFVNKIIISGEWTEDYTEELIKTECIILAKEAYEKILDEIWNSVSSLRNYYFEIKNYTIKGWNMTL